MIMKQTPCHLNDFIFFNMLTSPLSGRSIQDVKPALHPSIILGGTLSFAPPSLDGPNGAVAANTEA